MVLARGIARDVGVVVRGGAGARSRTLGALLAGALLAGALLAGALLAGALIGGALVARANRARNRSAFGLCARGIRLNDWASVTGADVGDVGRFGCASGARSGVESACAAAARGGLARCSAVTDVFGDAV